MCMPLACAIKNTALIFNAKKTVLTGSLIAHRSLFEKRLSECLGTIGTECEIEFIENCDSAAEGAALIALDRWIQTLRI